MEYTLRVVLLIVFSLSILIVNNAKALSLSRISIGQGEGVLHASYTNKHKFDSHVHLISKRDLPSSEFKFRYVLLGGIVSDTAGELSLQVACTKNISDDALDWATYIISHMTQFMPAAVFNQLCTDASVGIFTANETIAIFPEYAYLGSSPACKDSCAGTCSDSCTFDGRKFTSLAGLGGSRAVDLVDNVMCTSADPYFGTLNGLVHEFAHTTMDFGLTAVPEYVARISAAYANAKGNQTWDTSAYSMSTQYEYFACSTSAYFNADSSPTIISGGMNSCGLTSGSCTSELAARKWLQQQDPDLFSILRYAYSYRTNPDLFLGDITICPPANYDGDDYDNTEPQYTIKDSNSRDDNNNNDDDKITTTNDNGNSITTASKRNNNISTTLTTTTSTTTTTTSSSNNNNSKNNNITTTTTATKKNNNNLTTTKGNNIATTRINNNNNNNITTVNNSIIITTLATTPEHNNNSIISTTTKNSNNNNNYNTIVYKINENNQGNNYNGTTTATDNRNTSTNSRGNMTSKRAVQSNCSVLGPISKNIVAIILTNFMLTFNCNICHLISV